MELDWGQPRTAETLGHRKDGISDHQEPAGFFSECCGLWPDPHTQGGHPEWMAVGGSGRVTDQSLPPSEHLLVCGEGPGPGHRASRPHLPAVCLPAGHRAVRHE